MSDDTTTPVTSTTLPGGSTTTKAPPEKALSKAEKTPAKKQKKKKQLVSKSSTPVILTVKLAAIIRPEEWNRDKLGDIGPLIASLKSKGQVYPLIVRCTATAGVYMLVDGHRRLAALLKMGAKTALVIVKDIEDGDAHSQSMIANLVRLGHTSSEIARSCGKSVADGMTNEQIAKERGHTPGWVSQHLAVLTADKKLQAALKKETISLAVFRHFAKLNQDEDGDFYAKMMEKTFTGAPSQAIGDAIDAFLEKKVAKASKAAAKKGDKSAAKPAKKRGAAAHKSKSTPNIDIPDYRDAKVSKEVKMISKKDAIDWLDTYRDKALEATTARKREYMLGVLEGMEIMTGLLEED